MEFPKPTRVRDKAYLVFVRQRPCCVSGCNRQSDPHHVVTRARGGADYTAAPLCRVHHREAHDLGQRTFEQRHRLSLWRVVAETLAAFIVARMEDEQ